MASWMKWGLVLVAGLVAWSLSRNFDGPVLHWIITGLVVYFVYKSVMGM